MILLDTCALLFWTLDFKKITNNAKIELKKEKEIAISSISIWEIGIKLKRKKLEIPLSIADYLSKLYSIENFIIIPVNEIIWLKNLELDWNHQDPADRTIVATAIIHKCPLITSDKRILTYYTKAIW